VRVCDEGLLIGGGHELEVVLGHLETVVCVDMLRAPKEVEEAVISHVEQPLLVRRSKLARPPKREKHLLQVVKHALRVCEELLIERLVGLHMSVILLPRIDLRASNDSGRSGLLLVFKANFILLEFI
jgi:phosphoribosyl 1,2-cyclic phosphodiesterase